jgi:hypothetical protein
MAVFFDVPARWRRQWKVKIRDRERAEPPHVSVLHGTECWRMDLAHRSVSRP